MNTQSPAQHSAVQTQTQHGILTQSPGYIQQGMVMQMMHANKLLSAAEDQSE